MPKFKATIAQIGYFTPSNANWCWQVFLVTDKTGSRLYKGQFEEEKRLKNKNVVLEKISIGLGSDTKFAGKTVAKMPSIEWYDGRNWK